MHKAADFPRLEADFHSNTDAEFITNGASRMLTAPDEDALREVVVQSAADIATQLQRPVKLSVVQTDGTTRIDTELEVTGDASFSVVDERQTTPRRQRHSPEKGSPAAETTQPATPPSRPSTPPPHAPATEPTPQTVEAPSPPTASAPAAPSFPWEDIPEWKAHAAEPAATGWRAVLRLSPSPQELSARRAAFREQKEAEAEREYQEQERQRQIEQRRVDEEHREQQELSRRQALEERRQAERAKLNRTIQTNFQGTRTILVANPKGGARKTTTTYILGAMIGSTRGGSTIAWDANETMGTLGERAHSDRHHRTVVDLLEDGAQHFLDINSARVGVLDAYVRNQGDAHFDVLASDENPSRQDQIDDAGFEKVHDILSHFYRMILVDTGNNIRASHFVEAQKHADQLVIPVAASHDSKNRALDMMAAFTATGYDHLVEHAVVLVHELEPIDRDDDGTPLSNQSHEMTAAEIASAFDGRVRAVLPVPYDATLKDGGQIDFFNLSPETVRAYRDAAGAISDALLDRMLKTGRHSN